MDNAIYEWIGYTGSVLVAISLMMKNIYHLRRINLVGAATFSFYGYLVGAYPVVLLNGFIALVDLYYLIRMKKEEDSFSLMPVLDPSHSYMNRYLDFYSEDIKKFFPEFKKENHPHAKYFFVLRNMMPVGIFIYEESSDKEVVVLVDYVIPMYRDLQNGRYVYSAQSKYLKQKGFERLICFSTVKEHVNYLKKIGFDQLGESTFVLNT